MKCINKKMDFSRKITVLLSVMFLFTTGLCGCGQKSYSFSYDPDTSVSAFRITENSKAEAAASFASALCVADSDISGSGSVDMSQASAAGLFDLNNHEVLYAKNIHERLYPASLTKVMTALVALKYGNPEDIITVTANAQITESGAQLCGLKEGDHLTLDQALHALLMYSANDAGVAIAEHIGGSVEGFADMMNEEALAIGATNSHFVNPHGLQDENHYVTAYDMYLIFNEAMKYDLFTEIIHMTSYNTTYTDKDGNTKELDFETTNQYLKGVYQAPDNITVIGGKTGTTNAARNCLILLARDTSGSPYISVILGASERGILYEEMTALLQEIQK